MYQLSLPLLDSNALDSQARDLLEQVSSQLGFIPNLFAMMANCPGLLEVYRFGDQTFRQNSGFCRLNRK